VNNIIIDMAKPSGKLINARVSDTLAKQLDEYTEINRSAVVRNALQREVNIRKQLRNTMDQAMKGL
jgi:metal-responsive CopG/Arc/MetJ family transcriptional regulator